MSVHYPYLLHLKWDIMKKTFMYNMNTESHPLIYINTSNYPLVTLIVECYGLIKKDISQICSHTPVYQALLLQS